MTTNGGTIPKAAAYAMAVDAGDEKADELYPPIGATAAQYGDSDGKYAAWLNQKSQGAYVKDAAFFWNQPLSDSGVQQVAYVTYQADSGPASLTAGAPVPTGGLNAAGAAPNADLGSAGGTAAPSASSTSAPKGASSKLAAPVGIFASSILASSVIALLI